MSTPRASSRKRSEHSSFALLRRDCRRRAERLPCKSNPRFELIPRIGQALRIGVSGGDGTWDQQALPKAKGRAAIRYRASSAGPARTGCPSPKAASARRPVAGRDCGRGGEGRCRLDRAAGVPPTAVGGRGLAHGGRAEGVPAPRGRSDRLSPDRKWPGRAVSQLISGPATGRDAGIEVWGPGEPVRPRRRACRGLHRSVATPATPSRPVPAKAAPSDTTPRPARRSPRSGRRWPPAARSEPAVARSSSPTTNAEATITPRVSQPQPYRQGKRLTRH